MSLIQFIYCSASANPNLTHQELEQILEKSRSNNNDSGITGMLLYDSGSFFQVLEGDEEEVKELYAKIEHDPRHEHVTKLISRPINEREFGRWSMGYPRVTRRELEQIPGLNDFFSRGNSFLELETGRARRLLQAFKDGSWHV